ncbi:hypothetical protein AB4Z50_14140 [Paenibacillus sp. 2TAB26]|uniref:hypothetical protein n=1 Tax=Paenibacillus sp. 2TAB26 TaxID=3233005 RepID=UPI003F9491F3
MNNKIKKRVVSLLVVPALLISILLPSSSSVVSADENTSKEVYSEKQIDGILTNAGVPEDVLAKMDYDEKSFVISKSGENLKYSGSGESFFHKNIDGTLTEIPSNPDGVSTRGTIPTTDLILGLQAFVVTVNGVKMVDIYPSFEWKIVESVNNDTMAAAIADGWEVQGSDKTSCRVQEAFFITGTSWFDASPSDCGGAPSNAASYGYSWSSLRSNDDNSSWRAKGTSWFRAKKINSNASNKVIMNYAHDTKVSSYATYGVNISAFSVSYSVVKGSIDTQGKSIVFTY